MGFPTFSDKGPREPIIRNFLSKLKSFLIKRADHFSTGPSQSDYLRWYHVVACESHRQMLATALGVLGGEIVDAKRKKQATSR